MSRIKKSNYCMTIFILTLIFVFTVGLTSFAANKAISIGTGGVTGTYYPLGGCIANIISQYLDGVFATAETSGGSVANMRMVQNGEIQMGFVGATSGYRVFSGLPPYDEDPGDKVRSIAALYPETYQLIVLKNSGINSIADLKGKKVAVGAPGSGTEYAGKIILEEHGINYKNIKPNFLSFGEGVTALKDGFVDAVVIFAGIPTSSVIDVSSTLDVKILSLSPEVKARLLENNKLYTPVTIPKDMYRGMVEDIYTLGTPALLVTNIEQGEDFVYEITKTIFEHTEELANAHAKGKDITLETATIGLSIPLHPGAEKYYKEVGAIK